MGVVRVTVGPYQTNCYLAGTPEGLVVIDPGNDAKSIISAIEKLKQVPAAILLTHTHWDHITAIPALKERWNNLPLYAGEQDLIYLGKNGYSVMTKECCDPAFLFRYKDELERMPEADYTLKEGMKVFGFTVMETAGHTPGGVTLYSEKEQYAFTGDTLFKCGYGRYDFPGGDIHKLFYSIKKILSLPEKTVLYPGHGELTSVEEQRPLYRL